MKLSSTAIIDAFREATVFVVGSMTYSTPEPGDAFEKPNLEAFGDITAMVTVSNAEKQIASIALTVSKEAAEAMALDALGELEDADSDTREMVGEMMNILSGDARRRLAEMGLVLNGGTPNIILGSNHEVTHPCGGKTLAIPFVLPKGFCVVEFNFESFIEA